MGYTPAAPLGLSTIHEPQRGGRCVAHCVALEGQAVGNSRKKELAPTGRQM